MVSATGSTEGVTMGPLASRGPAGQVPGRSSEHRTGRRVPASETPRADGRLSTAATSPGPAVSSPVVARHRGWLRRRCSRPILAFLTRGFLRRGDRGRQRQRRSGSPAGIVTENMATAMPFARDVDAGTGQDQPGHQRHGDERPLRRLKTVEHADLQGAGRRLDDAVLHHRQDRLLSAREDTP